MPDGQNSNTVRSEVTIPNGYAVIVGGLVRKDSSYTISKVPWLGDLPILEYLFSLRTRAESESSLFVFIRPVILRDDRFEDLKYLSSQELELAGLPPNLPPSEPMILR